MDVGGRKYRRYLVIETKTGENLVHYLYETDGGCHPTLCSLITKDGVVKKDSKINCEKCENKLLETLAANDSGTTGLSEKKKWANQPDQLLEKLGAMLGDNQMTHALYRTSPKGERFVGTCTNCGATGLTTTNMKEECPNPRGATQDENLLEAIEKDNNDFTKTNC